LAGFHPFVNPVFIHREQCTAKSGVIVALLEVDRTLLVRCLDREPGAWKEFVDRFSGLFVHVIQHTAHSRSIALTPHDVDDLSADVFLALLANNSDVLRRFRGDSSLATYLTVICRRIVVHEVIRRRMAEEMGHVKTHGNALERAHVGEADASTRIDNRELVQRMLEGLSDVEAAVVRLFHLEGRSYHEISVGLSIPENSIGPILTRAREKLRKNSLASVSE
jgi:RNA polymerase sigma-70 factor (ECF subfamily)